MTRRWIAGIFLFALGFAISFLAQHAGAAPRTATRDGVIEDGLRYVDGADLTLQYASGSSSYLAVMARKPGNPPNAGTPMTYSAGSATFSRQDMQSLALYRLVPIGVFDASRVCYPPNTAAECPVVRPLPPRPPIRGNDLMTVFLDPAKLVARPPARQP